MYLKYGSRFTNKKSQKTLEFGLCMPNMYMYMYIFPVSKVFSWQHGENLFAINIHLTKFGAPNDENTKVIYNTWFFQCCQDSSTQHIEPLSGPFGRPFFKKGSVGGYKTGLMEWPLRNFDL